MQSLIAFKDRITKSVEAALIYFLAAEVCLLIFNYSITKSPTDQILNMFKKLIPIITIAVLMTSSCSKSGGPTKVSGSPHKISSGLEFWDLKTGTGAEATAGKHISVHYTGWLTDGTMFDSSVGRNAP